MEGDVSPATLRRIAPQPVAQASNPADQGRRRHQSGKGLLVGDRQFQHGTDVGAVDVTVDIGAGKAQRTAGHQPQQHARPPHHQHRGGTRRTTLHHMLPAALELQHEAPDGNPVGPVAQHPLPDRARRGDRRCSLFGMTHGFSIPFLKTTVLAIRASAGV
ncbi:hypothetical protein D3C72_1648190 [compost metagenome]